jgi:phosphatidylinositol glycan class B
MKEIWQSTHRKFFLLGLLCIVVASWCSIGYHQMDEHYMILEYANYKFGLVPTRVYPWEFLQKIRPALQPTMVYFIIQFLKSIGLQDAFVQVFLLRLLAGVLAWFVYTKAALRLSLNLVDIKIKSWWLIGIATFWFIPYLNVRFSSENFAGISFVAALLFLPDVFKRGAIKASAMQYVLAGFCLASAFYFRFQIAFAVLGLLLWLLLYARPLWKVYLFLFLGALVAITLNILVDHWFYGEWVLSPFRYYEANIVQNVASAYGVMPWYEYFVLFATQAVPPISWVLLVLFFIGLFKRPFQLMVFVFIPFLLGHMLVPHKEFRFLYPMLIPFLFICFTGLDAIWGDINNKKWIYPLLKCLFILNLCLLAYRMVWPASNAHRYYRFLYQYAKVHPPIHLLTLGTGLYDDGNNEIYIYRPKGFVEDTLAVSDYPGYMAAQNADSLLVLSYQMTLPYHDTRYNEERLYVSLPNWIVGIQLNNWQSRSDIWSIWRLRKKKPYDSN